MNNPKLSSLNTSLAGLPSTSIPPGAPINSPVEGILFQLADGSIQACNAAAEHILGFTKEQMQSWTPAAGFWQAVGEDGAAVSSQSFPATIALQTGQPCLGKVMGLYHPNGKIIWLEINAHPLFQANGTSPYGVVSTFTEIVELHQSLELNPSAEIVALPLQTHLHEAIFNESTDALFLVDPETLRTLDCNQRAIELFEAIDKQALIGIEGHTLQRHPLTPSEQQAIVADMQTKGIWIQEIEYVTQQGHSFWGNLAAKPIRVGHQSVNLVRITDITDRKQAETALRESQQRYQDLAEAMPQMVWAANATGTINYFNQRWYEYSGLSEPESMGPARDSLIHPQDRDRVLNAWRRGITIGEPFEIEYRLRRWDGVYHWFISRGIPRRDRQECVSGWIGTITEIDALKQAEDTIRQSEQHVRRVLDSLFSFVGVMTPDGVLIEANRTALVAAALDPQDVLGKPVDETYWWSYSPEIQAQLRSAIQQAVQGEVVRYDVQVRLGDNRFITIDFALVPLFNADGQVEYLIPSGIDITDRKQIEAALRESQSQLQQQLAEIEVIYQSAPIGLNVLDTNLRFVRLNQRLAEMNGLPIEAHLGRSLREVLPDLADAAEQVLRPILETGEPLLNIEISGETPAQPGVQRIWLEHFLPLKNGDQIIGISTVCEEITEQKQIEAERQQAEAALRQSEAQLRQQTEQLAQANRIKDEFLAMLSHELRTPLNPILGWSKLLQTNRLTPEKTQQALEAIERNARLQMQLIDDLLDISRIIRGKLTLNFAPLSLMAPITAAIETVHQTAEAKQITIDTMLDPTVGNISGDAGRLQQIVWNLLTNAIKFTPNHGQISVRLEQVNHYAQIQISDTGKGIHSEFLPYLFDMFRQQDSSTTRQFGGLGLGLAICRQLVEAQGGTITANSPGEGQGATFIVRLPLMPDSDAIAPNFSLPQPPLNLQGIRILVVDDEPDTLFFLQVLLEQKEAIVTTAASAQAALNILSQSPIDVLITDIQMPHMDGYTLIRQVRSHSQLQSLPAIALTAHASDTSREQALVAGFQQHLAKPIDPHLLIEAIAELVQS